MFQPRTQPLEERAWVYGNDYDYDFYGYTVMIMIIIKIMIVTVIIVGLNRFMSLLAIFCPKKQTLKLNNL